jgi:hypothetical protein
VAAVISLKVWYVARNRQATRIAVAEVPSAIAIGFEPPHQLLEYEDGTRDRRVEGNGEPGASPGSQQRSAIRPAAAGNPAGDMRHDGTHLYARPFTAERQPRADRQQPAEEFDRYQMRRRRRQRLF